MKNEIPLIRLTTACILFPGSAGAQLLTQTIPSTVQDVAGTVVPVTTSPAPLLPAEIVTAEADYDKRQQEIEGSISRTIAANLDKPAEERRDILDAWMKQLKPQLEGQQARSKAIDELYIRHGIVSKPTPETEPLTPLRRELSRIRREHGGDAEAMRDAMSAWMKVYGEDLKQEETMTTGPRNEAAAPLAPSRFPAVPLLSGVIPTPGSREALERRLVLLMADYPAPAPPRGKHPALEEVEAWRDALREATDGVLTQITDQHRKEAQLVRERIASENQSVNP